MFSLTVKKGLRKVVDDIVRLFQHLWTQKLIGQLIQTLALFDFELNLLAGELLSRTLQLNLLAWRLNDAQLTLVFVVG